MSTLNGHIAAVPGEKMSLGSVTILTLGGRELMRIGDDPMAKEPFGIGYKEYTCTEMAAIAHATIIMLMARGTNAAEVIDILGPAAELLKMYAQSAQTPF